MRPDRVAPAAGRISARQADWIVCVATALAAAPAIIFGASRGDAAVGLAVLPFATLPLLWRRRFPALVLAVLVAALIASVLAGRAAPGNVGILFGMYAAALYGGERTRTISGAAAGATSVILFARYLVTDRIAISPHLTPAVVFGALAAWALGEVTRIRGQYQAELAERATRLERERDEHARRAAEEERIRIARELHDVVSHHVSVIAVQAGAAHSTSQQRPERAREALAVIERTARTTLSELRALLGVLRAGGPEPPTPLGPRPSLAQLEELLARARAAGIEVTSRVAGTEVALDAVLDLAAYRVLQEALTNAIKHAPGAHAHVLLEYLADELRITVTDDGHSATRPSGTGQGLIGMHERIALVGGQLHAGALSNGGFTVRATLPLTATAAAGPSANNGSHAPAPPLTRA